MVACCDEEFILVIEDHARSYACGIEHRQVSAVTIKHLHAFEVADVDAAFTIYGDGRRRAKLPRLITSIAKPRYEISLRRKQDNGIVESANREEIPEAIYSYLCVQFGFISD